ncbi:M14 family zinc carboxypeptidase [Winogradskyella sp. 3972H.M.0a.05]|uniref:M14 family metallopeptidase n=1 Tax=Winogradskyella sp. 3972H.M.0a.05 TaxID=2950277 RepID=UPI0033923228
MSHRYICNDHIEPLLEQLSSDFKVKKIGDSENDEPIFSVQFGNGSKKILLWSQMHGNESTTTKALFDLFNCIEQAKPHFDTILSNTTITVIPILNPDGARVYTRVNTNDIDLNRDAAALTQRESRLLRKLFEEIEPDFCFNLHGQRTIFSAGKANKPATVSFLAPAEDQKRSLTKTRKVAMQLIAKLNDNLQNQIPDQVGRYDDAYHPNCVGDTFQGLGVPTILFEAGHYTDDYERDTTRFYIFQSLLLSLNTIANETIDGNAYKSYFNIPENEKLFFDIIVRNGLVDGNLVDVAVQYQEVLVNNEIIFQPKIEKIGDLSRFYAHKSIEANKHPILTHDNETLFVGYENDFVLKNNEKLTLIV